MIKPVLQDDRWLADVADARRDESNLHVWWLGQSGFLVQYQGRHLLFDPYLSDSLTKKYAATDKPHVRMTSRVVAPERLGFVDVVTSSHNHTDHLDRATLVPLLRANPEIDLIIPEANREFVADRLGISADLPCGLTSGERLEIKGLEFHAVPAAHEALDRDESGRHLYLGYVVRIGRFTVYHSGDTLRYSDLEATLRQWPIDLAILPINGSKPERRVAGNLSGREAARLAHDIGAGLVVPCHYEMFEFNTASPDEFVAACRELNQPHQVLRAGERLTIPPRRVC